VLIYRIKQWKPGGGEQKPITATGNHYRGKKKSNAETKKAARQKAKAGEGKTKKTKEKHVGHSLR